MDFDKGCLCFGSLMMVVNHDRGFGNKQAVFGDNSSLAPASVCIGMFFITHIYMYLSNSHSVL
ncbi:hypothetical protein HanXRQr2_Chr04g0158071 [Helianthus annuus]|uniref:Uncharacterized protein n=1 Tax=Helianthus annuus TaxID=4232 RepID=A0A251TBR2_HELAN|nr:hypothetical protein HanXRQr2_Chr04g0158071 [Helianthus annuus]